MIFCRLNDSRNSESDSANSSNDEIDNSMKSNSHHYDNDVDDDRTSVLRKMRELENSVYKRPRAQSMPEIFRGQWRKQIIEWMYVLIKYCKLNHEATAAAVYYLDAAVVCPSSSLINSPRDYQLCAMTALHLALKVYDSPLTRLVKLSCFVKLGNGEFTVDDIIQKEQDMVRALGWRISPPTADCFLQRYMELLPFLDDDEDNDDEHNFELSSDSDQNSSEDENEENDQLGPSERRRRNRLRKLEEIASEYIEVAMARDRFLCVPPSVIAYAALLSAIEIYSNDKQQQQQQCDIDFSTFLHNMEDIAEMGDIFADFDTVNFNEKDGTSSNSSKGVSRSVRRTKILLDRIVKGLTLPPEEEDDFFSTTELAMQSNFSCNHNSEKYEKNIFSDRTTAVKSSSPNSPTSTVSSVHTTSLT